MLHYYKDVIEVIFFLSFPSVLQFYFSLDKEQSFVWTKAKGYYSIYLFRVRCISWAQYLTYFEYYLVLVSFQLFYFPYCHHAIKCMISFFVNGELKHFLNTKHAAWLNSGLECLKIGYKMKNCIHNVINVEFYYDTEWRNISV